MTVYRGTIKLRRNTAATWALQNPTLAEGEPGYETDTGYLKIGNGSSAWISLPYLYDGDATPTAVQITISDSGTYYSSGNVEDALQEIREYVDEGFLPLTQTHNAQSGTTYTLVLSDANNLVTLTNASPIVVTVPTNASVAFPVGTQIDLAQRGTGAPSLVAAGGVTLNVHSDATPILNGQYAYATLVKIATDEWDLFGNLVAA